MAPPDVSLVSITEHNLWVRNSALLDNLWHPRHVAPTHYDIYAREIFWPADDAAAVRREPAKEGKPSYLVVVQGEMLVLP